MPAPLPTAVPVSSAHAGPHSSAHDCTQTGTVGFARTGTDGCTRTSTVCFARSCIIDGAGSATIAHPHVNADACSGSDANFTPGSSTDSRSEFRAHRAAV